MTPSSSPAGRVRDAVDTELHRFLDARRRALPESELLISEIGRLVDAGGKRLRPAFCYWGYRAAGGPHGVEIVRASASLELLHTFAIVHDDIMDDSDERRGVPTVHVRYGTGTAILAGDLALVLADALFFDAGFEPSVSLEAFEAYSLMRQEVIAGEFLDLVAGEAPSVSEEEARRIAVLKSGRYSIEKPLVIGACLAGADTDLLKGLSRFGDPLGEAFQLRDDLLGAFGERASVGKPVDSDIREGKRHVLYAKAMAALSGPEREFMARRWGQREDLTDDEVEHLRSLLDTSGARAATEHLLNRRVAAAAQRLAALPIDEEVRAALGTLAYDATHRTL
jgi:geranylgeranyl diphosphate synthase type I